MFFKKQNKEKLSVFRYFIFVEVPAEQVYQEVLLWDRSEWWPKNSVLKIIRLGDGQPEQGMQFKMYLILPFLFLNHLELNSLVPQQELNFIFVKGSLKGSQVIRIEARSNGIKVEYELSYQIQGLLNKIFWAMFWGPIFAKGIQGIFNSLKKHIVGKSQQTLNQS